MTNEEKATRIGYSRGGGFPMRDACIEMAEWKDQQFKEFLEKKREQESRITYFPSYQYGRRKIIDEIINELFKEEKK